MTGRHLAQQRKEVERNALRVLAHDAAGVGAAGIEVAEQGTVPLLVRVAAGLFKLAPLRLDVVCDDILDHDLGPAVCVCGPNGADLGDGDHVGHARGIAVDGGRRGEDDVADTVLLHAAQQRDAAADIDAVVLEGDLARLADGLEGGEVDNAVDLGVLGEDGVESGLVSDVDLVEDRAAAADQLDAVEGDLGRVVEAVDDDDIVAVLEEGEGREGPNVARTAASKTVSSAHRGT